LWFWGKKRGKLSRVYSEAGMSLIEVVVLFVAVGFFVIAAAPLFARFLQVRAGVDYMLQATVFAQDVIERIRGKRFEELEEKIDADFEDLLDFLYDNADLPPLPPKAEELSSIIIQREMDDMLRVEIEVKWREVLRASDTQERSYRLATYVYKNGIRKLRQ